MSRSRLGARLTPYLLVLPGWLWLVVFFVVPTFVMLSVSTQTGDIVSGFQQTFHWRTYVDGWNQYHTQFIRSIVYGLITTLLCLVIAYPVAYWIAFRGGAHKSSLLFLILLPFFVSFVIRTQSWNFILSDNGMLLSALKNWGLVSQDFHILATAPAVIGGLTYNFLPFMVLPIYVGLERLDPALLEAAADLYGSKTATFRKVVLPLSMPGVFAGVLLTFVPAAADYVNAAILGGARTTMIGNVIQTEYFTNLDYPKASALSFILMAALLLGVFAYARVLGTEDVLDVAAR
ncbi:MAG: spermidine/putrescine transport system permease protein [Pseudonocardiales bacterium]|nr:ABC-type spermidine/putrescine transport system, permease component [Jatrophihabitans sp.]MDT4904849.1 spermidine/putrescine transport system permease protein [Pseudonocardiales bacterium]MDT4931551.1 spermidine/putrescine transport system permease protein [Pseudonocardiales bacterium]